MDALFINGGDVANVVSNFAQMYNNHEEEEAASPSRFKIAKKKPDRAFFPPF